MTNDDVAKESSSSLRFGGLAAELNFEGLSPARVKLQYSGNSPAANFEYRVMKRVLDLLLVLTCSPMLIASLAVVALAIRCSSPGPVLFRQRRLRRDGKFFTMWKFRTMRVDGSEILEWHLRANEQARSEWQTTQKLRNDPRLTTIGSVLRRYSLDELPQFWNVLNGTMSLVGPRPIVRDEIDRYGSNFAYYCSVEPGITGLWQVSGRNDVSYERRVEFDCRYVNEWSLRQDIIILLRTVLSVLARRGAY